MSNTAQDLGSLLPFDAHFHGPEGRRQHYLDEGTGTPVLMVHGNPTWCYYYRKLVSRLSDRYRCIVPDHIGCGLSDVPSDSEYGYSLDDRVDDLDALLCEVAPEGPIDLVVHDWGGMIGMAWANRHPERLRRFVILNTAGFRLPADQRLPLAIAFARNPMIIAQQANDLQQLIGGRFLLGIGPQIRPHIENRFSMTWSRPAARMREFVLAIRAIWDCWAGGERLDFRGEFYTHTLMTPTFDPGPNPHGSPPIIMAGVGERMVEVAGEVADGLLVHPLNSPDFLATHTIPALEREEWAELADWFDRSPEAFHPNVLWAVQLPRVFHVWRKAGSMSNNRNANSRRGNRRCGRTAAAAAQAFPKPIGPCWRAEASWTAPHPTRCTSSNRCSAS